MNPNFARCAHLGAAAVVMTVMLGVQPASAACFEGDVGCTNDHPIPASALEPLSCDSLWTVRNMIFDENGYCFRTAKAKSVFSNGGCMYASMASMPLNPYEIKNIKTVRAVEKQKACY